MVVKTKYKIFFHFFQIQIIAELCKNIAGILFVLLVIVAII